MPERDVCDVVCELDALMDDLTRLGYHEEVIALKAVSDAIVDTVQLSLPRDRQPEAPQ